MSDSDGRLFEDAAVEFFDVRSSNRPETPRKISPTASAASETDAEDEAPETEEPKLGPIIADNLNVPHLLGATPPVDRTAFARDKLQQGASWLWRQTNSFCHEAKDFAVEFVSNANFRTNVFACAGKAGAAGSCMGLSVDLYQSRNEESYSIYWCARGLLVGAASGATYAWLRHKDQRGIVPIAPRHQRLPSSSLKLD